jgi:hypothetical protein
VGAVALAQPPTGGLVDRRRRSGADFSIQRRDDVAVDNRHVSPAAGNEWPLIKGRPALEIEQASILGTPGDIVLADLTQYALVDAGQKFNLSMDVDFASDTGAFRFVWRIDGSPLWSSPVTPWNGSGLTRSPFVALAQR